MPQAPRRPIAVTPPILLAVLTVVGTTADLYSLITSELLVVGAIIGVVSAGAAGFYLYPALRNRRRGPDVSLSIAVLVFGLYSSGLASGVLLEETRNDHEAGVSASTGAKTTTTTTSTATTTTSTATIAATIAQGPVKIGIEDRWPYDMTRVTPGTGLGWNASTRTIGKDTDDGGYLRLHASKPITRLKFFITIKTKGCPYPAKFEITPKATGIVEVQGPLSSPDHPIVVDGDLRQPTSTLELRVFIGEKGPENPRCKEAWVEVRFFDLEIGSAGPA